MKKELLNNEPKFLKENYMWAINIFRKFLNWLQKVRRLWSYDACYSERERDNYATMGCCGGLVGGDNHMGNLPYACIDCPYFVDLFKQ